MIAIFEGPIAVNPKGWRHYQLINFKYAPGDPKHIFSSVGRPGTMVNFCEALKIRFFAAGSWELDGLYASVDGGEFPQIKPSIFAELRGGK